MKITRISVYQVALPLHLVALTREEAGTWNKFRQEPQKGYNFYVEVENYRDKENDMATTTIRVSTETRNTLRELAKNIGLPMQQVVEQAIEHYRRQQLLNAANAGYAKLRADEEAWQAYTDESAKWESTLNDGLEAY
ncbi:MAG: hypothetical protein ACPGWR_04390 [Ardenticatenaceae bacterium]